MFLDPFCGSGTIPIEAALIAMNRAPGINRHFAAENFPFVEKTLWKEEREAAKNREFHGDYKIFASDNDPACVSLSMANARRAGVDKLIVFEDADAPSRKFPAAEGILVANPPYGQRMMEQRTAQALYERLGRRLKTEKGWKQYIITSEPEFERHFGRKADKKRKLYNGMIQCNYYMYLGDMTKGRKK